MSSYVGSLLDRYKPKGLLIDANLLLLLLVGSFNLQLVGDGKYNKLSKYTAEDYKLITRLTLQFNRMVTTPHVLTEVSNLANDLPEATKIACHTDFRQSFGKLEELAISSMDAAQRPEFSFLGLTDSALAHLSHEFLIVTDDARLVGRLNGSELEALNFNHLREHLFT